MQCPVDGETLMMSERNGVEIDYCPRCRGVWLDRGELDKIIERAGTGRTAGYQPAESFYADKHVGRRKRREDDDDDDRRKRKSRRADPYRRSKDHHLKRKTKSFLKEIFDFD